ncbi:hypothetical protein GSI_00003 [Ganoderma sinense ZZ0214-1]|uniref:Uncharacterized protein n=1 Tax=Ganoderma sinense ZZ0214-1 TaxID=1077348 RepID=A0A2G8SRB7_9APHY|nr:hypothetical protein GSI_00003 [Ganoderma sinense ZZ0214-1]
MARRRRAALARIRLSKRDSREMARMPFRSYSHSHSRLGEACDILQITRAPMTHYCRAIGWTEREALGKPLVFRANEKFCAWLAMTVATAIASYDGCLNPASSPLSGQPRTVRNGEAALAAGGTQARSHQRAAGHSTST